MKEIITCTSPRGSLSIGDGCVVGESEVPPRSNSLVRYQEPLREQLGRWTGVKMKR